VKPIILDTRSLFRDYKEYAPFFEFYESGLKDLIRDAILTRSFNSPYTSFLHHGHRYARGLVAKVTEDFEYALDIHSDRYGDWSSRGIYDVDRAWANRSMIQFVAGEIEQAADTLLNQHLRTRLFEIAQEGSGQALLPRWIGQDLLVFVRLLSPRGH
jgi:hypothetical protein